MNTYDVKIFSVRPRKRQGRNTYEVRWSVAKRQPSKTFKTRALAESFRTQLVAAARAGEAFDEETGLPMSLLQVKKKLPTWYEHSCAFVDMKWPHTAGKTRTSTADALATVTRALLAPGSGGYQPAPETVREALYNYAFNSSARTGSPPTHLADAVRWLTSHTLQIDELDDPEVIRRALDTLTLRIDGAAASPNTIARKRAVFHNVLDYAVELGRLPSNPLGRVKWIAPKVADTVDSRVVVNPHQAKRLLDAVGNVQPAGPRLVAFFGCIYYSALRPSEAVQLNVDDCVLPKRGWGELRLSTSAPRLGSAWSNSGATRDERQLKHRSVRDTRIVPAPPQLVALLREHIEEFATDRTGPLFRGTWGGPLSESVYGRVWQKAREQVMISTQVASPLGKRPYDLRHAAVSLWLNAGVPPQQVAEWAGHSVHVLLRVYAKCLDGEQEAARKRIERALQGNAG